MDAQELASAVFKSEINFLDRDILKSCNPERWHEMYSPLQLEGAMVRIKESIHHAVIFVNACDKIAKTNQKGD